MKFEQDLLISKVGEIKEVAYEKYGPYTRLGPNKTLFYVLSWEDVMEIFVDDMNPNQFDTYFYQEGEDEERAPVYKMIDEKAGKNIIKLERIR